MSALGSQINVETGLWNISRSTFTTALSSSSCSNSFLKSGVFLTFASGAVLSLLTILGNTIVTIAFYRCKRLQTASNLFIFSLALADLCVGILSINFYTMYVALDRWPLGMITCNTWLVVDYVCSQASVNHLLLISFDRYLSISRPIAYRAKRTKRGVWMAIGVAWAVAFFEWAPWIISYPYMKGKRTVPSNSSYIQFLYESWYPTLITAFAAYFAPAFLMVAIYFKIYGLMRRRANEIVHLTCGLMLENTSKQLEPGIHELKPRVHELLTPLPNSTSNVWHLGTSREALSYGDANQVKQVKERRRSLICQKKAAKMLSFILASFLFTWLPYHVCVVVASLCKTCVSKNAFNFAYMFCYVNSMLNPLCYAMGSKEFKNVFKSILLRSSSKHLDRSLCGSVAGKTHRNLAVRDSSENDTSKYVRAVANHGFSGADETGISLRAVSIPKVE